MEFFQNIFEFYRRNLFTDLAISTIDSQGCIHQVCHVHRLVFVSLFPRLKDALQENESRILVEYENRNEVLDYIEELYKCLGTGQNSDILKENGIFREYISHSQNDFEKESLAISVLPHSFLNDQCSWSLSNDVKNLKILKVQDKINDNFCEAITLVSITENELDFTQSKTCGNIISLIQDMFDCSIASILGCDCLRFIAEQGENNVSFRKSKPNDLKITKTKIKLDFIEENSSSATKKYGYFIFYDNGLKSFLQPMAENIQINQMVQFWTQLCGFQDVHELQNILLVKSLISSLSSHEKSKTNDDDIITDQNFEEEETNQIYLDALIDDHNDDITETKDTFEVPVMEQEEQKMKLPKVKRKHKKSPLKSKLDMSNLKCTNEGCDKKFNKIEAYRAHIRSYHHTVGSGVPCDKCGTMYQNFFFLKRHKRLQHDETPCKDCGSKFHGSNELSRHIRKEHLTGNEHICDMCGMGFKVKTYLKRHLRQQHPGSVKSPFVCQECQKPFGTGRKLRDHIQVFHVKTRPHKCREGVCDKSFTTINMRRRHEKQVHKLFIYTPSGTKSKFTVDPTQQEITTSNA